MADVKILRKHVSIIHSNSDVTVLQRKIINALLHEAAKGKYKSTQGLVAVDFCMPLSNVAKAIHFNSNNTKYLKEAIDNLALLTVSWNLLKDKAPDNISFLNLRFLHGSPTFYQNGTFAFSFHKFFMDLLNNPAIYGSIDLDIQSWFESKYSHSLYENSTRLVNLQQKYRFIEIDVFKRLLGVNDASYNSTAELTRSIITPALEEVNDRANFVVSIEKIKEGRSIIGFNVSIVKKDKDIKTDLIRIEQQAYQDVEVIIEKHFGKINKNILESIFNNYSKEYILQKIDYTIGRVKKETTGLYPVAYFISALKKDYKSNKIVDVDKTANEILSNNITSTDWDKKCDFLHMELDHWRRMQSLYLKNNADDKTLQSVQGSIDRYKNELEEHYSNKPIAPLKEGMV